MICYLLDEHIPPFYRVQLIRREPQLVVWCIGDEGAPPKGTPDPDILRWCEENGFILVTNNRKSMPRHLADHLMAGHHVPGVFIIDLNASVNAVIEEPILIVGASFENEYQDRLAYLPLTSQSV